jgi:hypothetical protein
MGRRGRELVLDRYSQRRMVDAYFAVYERVRRDSFIRRVASSWR